MLNDSIMGELDPLQNNIKDMTTQTRNSTYRLLCYMSILLRGQGINPETPPKNFPDSFNNMKGEYKKEISRSYLLLINSVKIMEVLWNEYSP